MDKPQDPEAEETVQTTNVPAVDLPRLVRLSEVTDDILDAVENEVGMGCGAWDCVPPKEIIAASWKFMPNVRVSDGREPLKAIMDNTTNSDQEARRRLHAVIRRRGADIRKPYTLEEICDRMALDVYNAELVLQHLLLWCSANVCVSDGPADAPELTRSAEGPFAARNG